MSKVLRCLVHDRGGLGSSERLRPRARSCARATRRRTSVIVRKAYGAGLSAMAGPAYDPDCRLTLPTAQIAVMGAQAAILVVDALTPV